MRRSPAPSDPEVEDEEDPEASPTASSHPRRAPRTSRSRPGRRASRDLKAWDDPAGSAPGEDDPEAEENDDPEDPAPRKERVYFRARDAWWFEPLVAAAVIVVLLASLFAYTQNWPPIYVVESESMQHGYVDQVGLINTGDLVLAQHIDPSTVQPYFPAVSTGYTTYGEYGDVILYHPDGDTSVAPIIHRALLYVQYSGGSYTLPGLAGLPCGNASNALYSVSSSASGCGTTALPKGTDLVLYHVGWRSVEVDITLSPDPQTLGPHSGFLTMGDNNFDGSNTSVGVSDQFGQLSQLVEGSWIIGAARGMIPWFGALKLALDGHAEEVPPQSWQYMGLTVVVVFIAALSLHLFLRREGIEDDRRKLQEEEEEREKDEEEGPPKGKKGGPPRRGLRLWASGEDADAEEEPEGATPARAHAKGRAKATGGSDGSPRRGRPEPKVGRGHPRRDDEEDEAL